MFILFFVLFSWLAWATPVEANPVSAEACTSYCLTVTPIICVTAEANASCEQRMHIHWQGLQTTQSACAYLENALLKCWDAPKITANKTSGSWQGLVTWPEEGTVSLTDHSGAIVAEVAISTQSLRPRRTGKMRSTPTQ